MRIITIFSGLLLLLLSSAPTQAAIDVAITKSANDASPIAIVPFSNDSSKTFDFDIADLIASDLQKTAQLRRISNRALPSRPALGDSIAYLDWQQIGANHLLLGRVHHAGSEALVVDIELYDVVMGSKILSQSFTSKLDNMRRTTHYIADQVYEKITGVRGAFNTQIAYISVVHHSATKATYKLMIADSDGYNPQSIVTSSAPLLSPAWSADARKLAYVSMRNQHAEIYILDLNTGKEYKAAAFAGINGAPAFAPNNREMVASLSKSGVPKLYVLNLQNRTWRQLTDGRSIDTEPSYSGDGRYIYFTSSRSGSAQIYKIASSGGMAQRVSFKGNYNAAASASSDDRNVAMVHRGSNGYTIGVFDQKDDVYTVISRGLQDESPSFAPNGKMLLYAGQDRGIQVLVVASVDGRSSQTLLSLGEDIREPAWSPYLPLAH